MKNNLNNNTPEISVIIPVYNEEGNIIELYNRLVLEIERLIKTNYEIIFIDDGSKDQTWDLINNLNSRNSFVKGIKLSRNFGHQNALKAGLDFSKGKAVISLDGDLQQPPELISKFYNYWKKGFDIVYGSRVDTKGVPKWKEMTSSLFYKFLNYLSDTKLDKGSSDFRLLDRKVVNELKKFNENLLFLRGIVGWIGFNSKAINYTAEKRFHGKTKYSFMKMIKFGLDGIMSFSIKPLRVATITGFLISFIAFGYIIYALLVRFVFFTALPGWTSILVWVLFIGGIQLICIGIAGEYIGKLFLEVKKRQIYVVDKILDN